MVLRVVAVALGASLDRGAVLGDQDGRAPSRVSVSFVTRWVFLNVQHVFRVLARPSLSLEKRDRRLAWYSPLGLVATLAAWLTLTLAGFMFMFWGVEDVSMRSAFVESGSALLTLGLTRPNSLPGRRHRVHRGRHRPVPAGAPDHVPAEHLRGVLPARARRDRAGDPRGLAAVRAAR